MNELCDDLAAETASLDEMQAGLAASEWDTPTPAPGWSVRDQITHLAYFDDASLLALTDPGRFRAERDVRDVGGFVESVAAAHRDMSGPDVLAWFRRSRAALVAAFRSCDPSTRVPWYGPDMSATSKVTARLMETWAHGYDVADALGVEPVPSGRLRHVAYLGFRALPNSYVTRGLAVPETPVRVELIGPSGETWTFGHDDADGTVRGPALDFCLVVCQRRHRDDTALVATGAVANEWLAITQAFAGPPGPGRAPRS